MELTSIGSGSLNEAGEVAFSGILRRRDNTQVSLNGLWRSTPSGLTELARTGWQAPGLSVGTLHNAFSTVVMNDLGEIAVVGTLSGSEVTQSVNDEVIWKFGGGSATPVARTDGIAPGPHVDMRFESFRDSHPVINNNGEIAFYGEWEGNDTANGIWTTSNSVLEAVVIEGTQAAGFPNGVNYGGLFVTSGIYSRRRVEMDQNNRIAFDAAFPATPVQGRALWVHDGTPTLVARNYENAPGTAGFWGSFNGNLNYGIPAMRLNDTGHFAFRGIAVRDFYSGPSASLGWGIWSNRDGAISLVARTGDVAPGIADGTFTDNYPVDEILLNSHGDVAFASTWTDPSVASDTHYGVWKERNRVLELVVHEKMNVPGVGDGVRFASIFSLYQPQFDFNDRGEVAFYATIEGASVDSTNDSGIWLNDAAGVIHPLLLEGQAIDVNPDPAVTDIRQIYGFLPLTPQADILQLNNRGEVLVGVSFNGGQGLLVVSAGASASPSADFDADSDVDGNDFLRWQRELGLSGLNLLSDGSRNGVVDSEDLMLWRNSYGHSSFHSAQQAIPEPPTPWQISLLLSIAYGLRRTGRGAN